MKNLDSIDCLKLIMAIAVIAIHVSAVTGAAWPPAFEWFIRLAVPFFFITSGYLLAAKISGATAVENRTMLRDRSLKLLRLYAKWLLIYLPIAIYYFICVSTRSATADLMRYFSMVLIDGESPYAWPLWFIFSMAIVLMLLSFATRFKQMALAGLLIFALIYLINYVDITSIANPHLQTALKIFDRLTVRTLGGGMYVCAGMLIYRYGATFARTWFIPLTLIGISLLLSFGEFPFSPLCGGSGLFILGLKIKLPVSPVYLKIRAASMWIYYIHMIVLFPVIVIRNSTGYDLNPYAVLIYGAVASSLLAWMLIRLQRLPGFSRLSALIR